MPRILHISLPPGWHEEPAAAGRIFWSPGPAPGCLRIQFLPAAPELSDAPQALLNRLHQIVQRTQERHDPQVLSSHGRGALGLLAASLWQLAEGGLGMFWLIPSEPLVFASFTSPEPDPAHITLAQAGRIIETMQWIEAPRR